MNKYHKDIGFPKFYIKPQGGTYLVWTYHAIEASVTDQYGAIPQLEYINLSDFEVIEIETEGLSVVKYLVRGRLDDYRDMILALIPRDGEYVVKTVWSNIDTDEHKTLRTEVYDKI